MKRYIGIDIGGTTTKFGIFLEDGILEEKWQINTRIDEGGRYIIPDIAKCIEEKFENLKESFCGIGLGIPGPVDLSGYVEKCVNLNWYGCNPARELNELLHIPVYAGNDANVAALGEQWQGAGKNYQDVVLLTLGTGVGGGVIIGGRIVNGRKGIAGEIGHLFVNPDETELCNCGNRGCLDQMASATGIVRNAKRFLEKSDKESVLRNISPINAKEVAQAAEKGDELAEQVLQYCLGFLGKSLAIVTHVIAPEVFIIGGGVSAMGEMLLHFVEKEFSNNLYLPTDHAPVRLALLGGDAGIFGAARMAMLQE